MNSLLGFPRPLSHRFEVKSGGGRGLAGLMALVCPCSSPDLEPEVVGRYDGAVNLGGDG